jgi:hypothetical protein
VCNRDEAGRRIREQNELEIYAEANSAANTHLQPFVMEKRSLVTKRSGIGRGRAVKKS